MGLVRKIGPAMIGVSLLLGGVPVAAEQPEPLVVTQLADPDPNYAPPPSEPKHKRWQADADDDVSALDTVMADFGNVLRQAIVAQQQLIDQRCKSSEAAAGAGPDRMAWEAACKYTRR